MGGDQFETLAEHQQMNLWVTDTDRTVAEGVACLRTVSPRFSGSLSLCGAFIDGLLRAPSGVPDGRFFVSDVEVADGIASMLGNVSPSGCGLGVLRRSLCPVFLDACGFCVLYVTVVLCRIRPMRSTRRPRRSP